MVVNLHAQRDKLVANNGRRITEYGLDSGLSIVGYRLIHVPADILRMKGRSNSFGVALQRSEGSISSPSEPQAVRNKETSAISAARRIEF